MFSIEPWEVIRDRTRHSQNDHDAAAAEQGQPGPSQPSRQRLHEIPYLFRPSDFHLLLPVVNAEKTCQSLSSIFEGSNVAVTLKPGHTVVQLRQGPGSTVYF